MKSFQRILVGVDYSRCSRNALREAARLAAFEEAELRIVHVIHDELASRMERLTGALAPEIRLGHSTRLENFVIEALGGFVPKRLSCETFVAHRFVEMMRQVEHYKADLLVLGQHGDLEDPVRRVGSLATKCVRKAPCQVLLVDERHEEPYGDVIAAVDFSVNSREALYEAAEICRCDSARLHIIHVHYPPWIYFMNDLGHLHGVTSKDELRYRENLDKEFKAFLTHFHDGFDDVPVKVSSIEKPSNAAGILSYVDDVGADLVVMGTVGNSTLEVHVIGSTAEHVISRAACSVLAIRPEGVPFGFSRRQQAS